MADKAGKEGFGSQFFSGLFWENLRSALYSGADQRLRLALRLGCLE